MVNHTNDKNENAPQVIGENVGASVTDAASQETFEEYWDPFEGEDGFVACLHDFAAHLNATKPGHGLSVLEIIEAMNAVPAEDWRYGFGFSDLSSRERVYRRLRVLQNPKVWPEEYSDTHELAEILREPECPIALTEEDMLRLIEEHLQAIRRTIAALPRQPENLEELIAAMRSDLTGLAHQALRAA